MNYGYEHVPGKDAKLYHEIGRYLCKDAPEDADGNRAYVEISEAYGGVRVRRLTHFTNKQVAEIVARCDEIYDEVVGEYPIAIES